MDEKIQQQIDSFIKRAEQSTFVETKSRNRHRSSLHQIIKTKEQAEKFMKMLKSA